MKSMNGNTDCIIITVPLEFYENMQQFQGVGKCLKFY